MLLPPSIELKINMNISYIRADIDIVYERKLPYFTRDCYARCQGDTEANRFSSETSFVSYFAKHETKQVSCSAKQTCRFAKFCFEAKLAVSHVSLFFKRNETVRFAYFVAIQLIPFYIKSPLT
jgi:hypothetical protein